MERFTALFIFTKILGILLLVLTLNWLYKYRGGFKWQAGPKLRFNWHPLLMLVGMILLYSSAILVYRTLKHIKKFTAKLIHGGLNIIGFVCTVIGLKAVFDSHNLATPPIPNLYSLHSWIGLASVILFAFQFLFGFLVFLFPGMSLSLRQLYHPIHTSFGTIGFVFATIASLLGFLEKAIFSVDNYSNFDSEGMIINVIGIILLVYSTMVVYMVLEEKFKRPVSNEESTLLTPKE